MTQIQNIIIKYNKIIFKISFINNSTNLMFYNFFFLSSDFGCIKKKDYNLLVTLLAFYFNLMLKRVRKNKKIFK